MLLTVVSRHSFTRKVTIRTLSSAAFVEFSLPTRHSRNLPPPVCRDALELNNLTAELQQVKFVPYTLSQEDDLWELNDTIIQKAEYTIRGHAACIPDSLWYKNGDSSSDGDPTEHVDSMQAILTQLQQQNNIYMNLRRQLRSQVAEYSNDDDNDSDSSSSSSDDDESTTTSSSSSHSKAGPGPTVEMWDTMLDSMAVSLPSTSPLAYKDILEKVLKRHSLDGGPEYNTNPYTFPTILTFNAVLRGVANVDYSGEGDEMIRDDALETAFGVYDEMKWHADRNSATFVYMLGVVEKFLPPSRSRGNIAHGLWSHATRMNVASSQVLDALHKAHKPSNGEQFDEWLEMVNNIRKTPLEWRKKHKQLRYNRGSATY